jgi:hypothetical protein
VLPLAQPQALLPPASATKSARETRPWIAVDELAAGAHGHAVAVAGQAALLDRVGDLVGQQGGAARGVGGVATLREVDVAAVGEGVGPEVAAHAGGVAVAVEAQGAEADAEAGLEAGAGGARERPAAAAVSREPGAPAGAERESLGHVLWARLRGGAGEAGGGA